MDCWYNFKGKKWQNKIDVEDFVQSNYTQYNGDAGFLASATPRTLQVKAKLDTLLKKEADAGGVLDVDTNKVSSILSFDNGYLDKDLDIIVGLQTDKPLKRAVNPFGGIKMAAKACEAYGYELDEDVKKRFIYRTTHNDGVFRCYSEEMKKARHIGIITGLPDSYGRGRIIGDYRRVALYGMDYLISCKKADKDDLQKQNLNEENIKILEELYKQIEFMQQAKIMAENYGYDISLPATNAKEAVQWLYFGYLCAVKEQNGAANSIGRISTFLDIYIQRDLENKIITEQQAQELMDDLIVKLRLVRHLRTQEYNDLFAGDPVWVTMSEAGVTKDGRHLVTKNSFRTLKTLYNLGAAAEPNITVLWSKELPENYKKYCARVSIDTDSIQYENDDIMRPIYGGDYSIACCVSAMKTGKQMQYFGARCNMAKLLLLALNGGKDEMTGENICQLAPEVTDEILDYNKVMELYYIYRSWIAKLYVNTLNIIHFMHDKYAYERFMMSLHDTKVERLMAFGISGLSVLVDSLSAIKYAKVMPIRDEKGLIIDFRTEGEFPKFGNDDDRVDNIATAIVEDFYKELCKTPAYRNAKHTLSILTITSNVVYGKKTGATPDGRKRGEPFAPGANPMHGRDSSGALASLNSVAKIRYCHCLDGVSNTFSVVPGILGESSDAKEITLANVLDGYFEQGAHHLNVNVLDREKLLDAMDNPEKYPNLTIRVSGYAVDFHKLNRNQQKEVIARTFHQTM